MAAGGFVNIARFTASSSGTGDFVVSAAVTGYQTPASANAVNGTVYSYRAESSDLSEWEIGEGAYTSGSVTLARTTVHASTNAGAKVSFSAAPQVAITELAGDLPILTGLYTIHNASLAVSAAASALTIALKDSLGNDPSAGSPVIVNFRSATGTTGSGSTVAVTGATSLVISSGSTLGVTSSTAFRLWVVGFNDAGTFRLGVMNCSTGGDSANVYAIGDDQIASSTAEGGAGAADSTGTFYTGSAVTSKAYRVLGYLEWNKSGLTAGTWTTTNLAKVQAFGPGIPLPGRPTGRMKQAITTTGFSTTSSTYQSTTVTIDGTLTAAANLWKVDFSSIGSNANPAATVINIAPFRGSTQLTPFQAIVGSGATAIYQNCAFSFLDKPNDDASVTYVIKIASTDNTNTGRLPTNVSGASGQIMLTEIMG